MIGVTFKVRVEIDAASVVRKAVHRFFDAQPEWDPWIASAAPVSKDDVIDTPFGAVTLDRWKRSYCVLSVDAIRDSVRTLLNAAIDQEDGPAALVTAPCRDAEAGTAIRAGGVILHLREEAEFLGISMLSGRIAWSSDEPCGWDDA